MYQPPHFRETRLDVLHTLIRTHPLGLLISAGVDGPLADPLPFLVDDIVGGSGVLLSHLSKANPHWRHMEENPDKPVLVVFQGPQAYVTPSWYETKRKTGKVVPTWNYALVQARGKPELIHDSEWLRSQVDALTRAHEDRRTDTWKVTDAPGRFIDAQINGIVGLRIVIDEIEGKWKMSQNRPAEDRAGVAAGYQAERNVAMAANVRERDV